jgi:serine/threonine-protein kinase
MYAVAAETIISGKYRLDRPLAEGGMGSVWVGYHLALDIPIAVKFMDPKLLERSGEGWQKRFEREAKAAAKLRHPQVVQVFDHGIEDGTPFIVMELLEGEDLGTRLKRVGPMDIEDAAWILAQTAKPLQRAHDLGYVHRDLKPGNLFLAKVGDDESIKLLDFGIAKAPTAVDAGESTTTELVFGSPVYMSPEQATGAHDVDWRTDLWALGVIMFRVLTGSLPFRGTVGQVLLEISSGEPPSAIERRPELPETIDNFFLRAFAHEPTARFQSAPEMAASFALIAGVTAPSMPSLPKLSMTSASVAGLQWDDDSRDKPRKAAAANRPPRADKTPDWVAPARSRRRLALWVGAISICIGGLAAALLLPSPNGGAEPASSPAPAAPSPATTAKTPATTPSEGETAPSAATSEPSAAAETTATPPRRPLSYAQPYERPPSATPPPAPPPGATEGPTDDPTSDPNTNEFGY